MYVWYGASKEMAGDPCDSFTHVFLPERIESQPAQVGVFFLVFAMYLVIRDVWGSLYLSVPCKASTE